MDSAVATSSRSHLHTQCRLAVRTGVLLAALLLGMAGCGGSGGQATGQTPPPPVSGPPDPGPPPVGDPPPPDDQDPPDTPPDDQDPPPPDNDPPPGDGEPSDPPPDNGNTTPLALTSSTPEADASDVARAILPTLTFSTTLDASTVTATAVSLRGPSGEIPLALTTTGNQITLTPSRGLKALAPYTITVNTDIRGSLGEVLTGPASISFTSEDARWRSALPIVPQMPGSTFSVESLRTASDGQGNVIAVWVHFDGVASVDVVASRYTPATNWSTPEPLDDRDELVSLPDIAFDARGNAIAVWVQDDGHGDSVWANHYVAGTGWGDAELVEHDEVHAARAARIAVHANGDAIAIWQQKTDVPNVLNLRSSYFTAGAWGAVESVETDDVADDDPDTTTILPAQIAFDAAGNAIAVWAQSSDNVQFRISANRFTPTERWGEPAFIDDGESIDWVLPRLAIDSQGNALATWSATREGRSHVAVNHYIAGEEWGTAGTLDTADSLSAGAPDVAFDANGNAVAVWSERTTTLATPKIWSRRFTSAHEWEDAVRIESDTHDSFGPRIAFDADGSPRVLWTESIFSDEVLVSNRFALGSWTTPKEVSNRGVFTLFDANLTVDSDGNAVAIWLDQFDALFVTPWFNRLD